MKKNKYCISFSEAYCFYYYLFGKDRRFSFIWFHKYHWIEYSVEKDAAYCFSRYLFGKESGKFITNGWYNWKMRNMSLQLYTSLFKRNTACS